MCIKNYKRINKYLKEYGMASKKSLNLLCKHSINILKPIKNLLKIVRKINDHTILRIYLYYHYLMMMITICYYHIFYYLSNLYRTIVICSLNESMKRIYINA
jgi:hypothetical protein